MMKLGTASVDCPYCGDAIEIPLSSAPDESAETDDPNTLYFTMTADCGALDTHVESHIKEEERA